MARVVTQHVSLFQITTVPLPREQIRRIKFGNNRNMHVTSQQCIRLCLLLFLFPFTFLPVLSGIMKTVCPSHDNQCDLSMYSNFFRTSGRGSSLVPDFRSIWSFNAANCTVWMFLLSIRCIYCVVCVLNECCVCSCLCVLGEFTRQLFYTRLCLVTQESSPMQDIQARRAPTEWVNVSRLSSEMAKENEKQQTAKRSNVSLLFLIRQENNIRNSRKMWWASTKCHKRTNTSILSPLYRNYRRRRRKQRRWQQRR